MSSDKNKLYNFSAHGCLRCCDCAFGVCLLLNFSLISFNLVQKQAHSFPLFLSFAVGTQRKIPLIIVHFHQDLLSAALPARVHVQ